MILNLQIHRLIVISICLDVFIIEILVILLKAIVHHLTPLEIMIKQRKNIVKVSKHKIILNVHSLQV